VTPPRFPFAAGVRAVLFDAGNTLLWLDHARIAAILAGRGVATDETAVRRAERAARPRLDPWLAGARRREGLDVARRYAEFVLEGLGAPPGGDTVRGHADAVLASWPSLWVRPPADARPTLERLVTAGYRVGVVSNSNGTVGRLLDQAGLRDLLGCVVDSALEGVEKPDPEIFRRGAERLGAPPAACVYVGDFRSLDVLGARSAGMEGVLLDPDGVWGAPGSAGGESGGGDAGAAVAAEDAEGAEDAQRAASGVGPARSEGPEEFRAASLAEFAERLLGG